MFVLSYLQQGVFTRERCTVLYDMNVGELSVTTVSAGGHVYRFPIEQLDKPTRLGPFVLP